MAFPFGTYQHSVIATPKTAPGIKPIEVTGVMRSEPYDVRMVGLSPMGSTVFRIHDDLCSGEVTQEFYIEELKKNQKHFSHLYQLIKAALFARQDRPEFDYHGAHIRLSEPDKKKIPRRIEIDHPYLALDIHVTSYEVSP
jgi:hypothetical protein